MRLNKNNKNQKAGSGTMKLRELLESLENTDYRTTNSDLAVEMVINKLSDEQLDWDVEHSMVAGCLLITKNEKVIIKMKSKLGAYRFAESTKNVPSYKETMWGANNNDGADGTGRHTIGRI